MHWLAFHLCLRPEPGSSSPALPITTLEGRWYHHQMTCHGLEPGQSWSERTIDSIVNLVLSAGIGCQCLPVPPWVMTRGSVTSGFPEKEESYLGNKKLWYELYVFKKLKFIIIVCACMMQVWRWLYPCHSAHTDVRIWLCGVDSPLLGTPFGWGHMASHCHQMALLLLQAAPAPLESFLL